jgi:Transposase and inactivated derivatives
MLSFSVPPGYRRTAPIKRPKLDGFTEIIDQWLRDDVGQHRKQRHTAKRVFDRLRDEHGFTGGYTIIKDYVRDQQRRRREMFVPLHHEPGHAQADFGEALVVIGGIEQKAHFFALDLPHSDASYIRAYPAATAEAWIDGHVHAFAFFGRVPLSVLYDNDRCLVARILPDGVRKRARLFSGFLSHYLIRDRYGRPGKGNDKGSVEVWSAGPAATSWCRCRVLRLGRFQRLAGRAMPQASGGRPAWSYRDDRTAAQRDLQAMADLPPAPLMPANRRQAR